MNHLTYIDAAFYAVAFVCGFAIGSGVSRRRAENALNRIREIYRREFNQLSIRAKYEGVKAARAASGNN